MAPNSKTACRAGGTGKEFQGGRKPLREAKEVGHAKASRYA